MLRLVCPYILLLFIERWRHLADSNEPNFINKNVIKFNWVTGSPTKCDDTLVASWYPTYMQSFIISHSSCAEQYGDMSSDTQTHSRTHRLTHGHTDSHTIKQPTAVVQLVGHTSIRVLLLHDTIIFVYDM